MSKIAKSKVVREGARGRLWLHLPGMVREALYDTVIGAGLACVDEALEMERVALCGERYEHLVDRQALRAGHVASSLVLGGRRVAVNRSRARTVEVISSGCRVGEHGAYAIHWTSVPWSRWCWEYRREAMRARWSHYRMRSRYVQPGARDWPAGQTLAERHHGAALDRRRCARSRARFPSRNWI